ncbi:MAG: hypothetical protein GF313_04795 [Caldithrix sp.]|nr:hypothetical protein [Caldithrix sp.]
MKRQLFVSLLAVFTLALLMACGGGKKMSSGSGGPEVFEDPFQDLTNQTNQIIDGGGVAAVGQGTSKRQDLAKKKAETDAKGQLAEIFNSKVQRMNKSFQEEIGSADDTEINEAFTTVTKTLSSQVLKGAITKKVKYMRDPETGQFTAAALVAIEPNKVNMSILDELQKKDKKLYERFRASQAYEELKNEMQDYEKQQQGNY